MIRRLLRTGSGGFTLIELLIVIAIIALLAVAVLAAINPIEQINKSRDTGKISDASQLVSAIDRFYANKGLYPWNVGAFTGGGADTDPYAVALGSVAPCTTASAAPDPTGWCTTRNMPITGNTAWLMQLVTAGEVKRAYFDRIIKTASNANPLLMIKAGSSDSVFVCFRPQSQTQKDAALARCVTEDANLPASACPAGSYSPVPAYTAELVCTP